MISTPITTTWKIYSAAEFFDLVMNAEYGVNAIRIYNHTLDEIENDKSIFIDILNRHIIDEDRFYRDGKTKNIGFRYHPVTYSATKAEFTSVGGFDRSLKVAGNDSFAVKVNVA